MVRVAVGVAGAVRRPPPLLLRARRCAHRPHLVHEQVGPEEQQPVTPAAAHRRHVGEHRVRQRVVEADRAALALDVPSRVRIVHGRQLALVLAAAHIVQVLGVAITANSLLFNPSNDIIEHA